MGLSDRSVASRRAQRGATSHLRAHDVRARTTLLGQAIGRL